MDLFEQIEQLPEPVQNILKEFEQKYEDEGNYTVCNWLIEQLKPLGYTCDYGLDAIPYDLRKLE